MTDSPIKQLARRLMPPEDFTRLEDAEAKFVDGMMAAQALYPYRSELLDQGKLDDDFKRALHGIALVVNRKYEELFTFVGVGTAAEAISVLGQFGETMTKTADNLLGANWRDAMQVDVASYVEPPPTMQ